MLERLGPSLVAHLLHVKAVIDDVKGVLDLAAHIRFELHNVLTDLDKRCNRQNFAFSRSQLESLLDGPALVVFQLLNVRIAQINEDDTLVTMQQGMDLSDALGVYCGCDQRKGETRLGLDTEVRLHAEAPILVPSME